MSTYYKNKFPVKDEVVLGRIIDFKDEVTGSWRAALPAYGDLEALVFFPKLRRRQFQHLNKKAKAKSTLLPFSVQEVDPVRGTANIFYLRAKEEETNEFLTEFSYLEKINRLAEGLVNIYEVFLEKEGLPALEDPPAFLRVLKGLTVWEFLEERGEDQTMKELYYQILLEKLDILLPTSLFPTPFLPLARRSLEKKVPKTSAVWNFSFYLCTFAEEGVALLQRILVPLAKSIEESPCQGSLLFVSPPSYRIELTADTEEIMSPVKALLKEQLETAGKEPLVYFYPGEEEQKIV